MTHTNETNFLFFQADDGAVHINVRLEGETVWLAQKAMSVLFDCTSDNISLHLKNIFNDGELQETAVTEEFSVTATDGKKYSTKHYNLDQAAAERWGAARQFRRVGTRLESKRSSYFIGSFLKETI